MLLKSVVQKKGYLSFSEQGNKCSKSFYVMHTRKSSAQISHLHTQLSIKCNHKQIKHTSPLDAYDVSARLLGIPLSRCGCGTSHVSFIEHWDRDVMIVPGSYCLVGYKESRMSLKTFLSFSKSVTRALSSWFSFRSLVRFSSWRCLCPLWASRYLREAALFCSRMTRYLAESVGLSTAPFCLPESAGLGLASGSRGGVALKRKGDRLEG